MKNSYSWITSIPVPKRIIQHAIDMLSHSVRNALFTANVVDTFLMRRIIPATFMSRAQMRLERQKRHVFFLWGN